MRNEKMKKKMKGEKLIMKRDMMRNDKKND